MIAPLERTYTAFFPFCGLGGGALGFQAAEMRLFDQRGRFVSLGGIDFDAEACKDFERLTGSPALCADVAKLTAADLRAFVGETAPDVVFLSPPCKGASGLLSEAKAKTAKYAAMNELALVWTRLMLEAWPTRPKLVLVENVPRLKQRAGGMLRKLRSLLHQAGYLSRDGFHDCGEIGSLAQHRRRFLLVARHQERVPPLLFQPIKRRVRACGEVLGQLPLPGAPEAGRLHQLPRISWLNWVRLALIPAGGDWRDLPGVLVDGQARREKFRRHHVADWEQPTATVAGPGSNGPEAVADPRPGDQAQLRLEACNANRHHNKYVVTPWGEPARTVIGATRPGSGALGVADERSKDWFKHVLRVVPWGEAAGTITSSPSPSSGAPAVADPRMAECFRGAMGVRPWGEPSGAVTGESWPQNGTFSVADPRVPPYPHCYGVLSWQQPSFVVAGQNLPGCGMYSVADPRLEPVDPTLACAPRAGAYGVLSWQDAAATITGAASLDNGAFAVADPRCPDAPPVFVVKSVRKPPEGGIPVILAEDETWHRPLTTLELAALQGFPTTLPDGKPLELAGTASSRWRERIGNAVPPPAAQAIAERMLSTLLQADHEAFALSGDSEVWVEPAEAAVQAGGVS